MLRISIIIVDLNDNSKFLNYAVVLKYRRIKIIMIHNNADKFCDFSFQESNLDINWG